MPASSNPRHQVSKKADEGSAPMEQVLHDTGKAQTEESQRFVDLARRLAAFTSSRRAPLTTERKPGILRTVSNTAHRPSTMDDVDWRLFHNFDALCPPDEFDRVDFGEDLKDILQVNWSDGTARCITIVKEINREDETKNIWVVQAPRLLNRFGHRLFTERLTERQMERLNGYLQREHSYREVTWEVTATDNAGQAAAFELSLPGYPWRASSTNTSATQTPISSGASTPSTERRQYCLNLDSIPIATPGTKQMKAIKTTIKRTPTEADGAVKLAGK